MTITPQCILKHRKCVNTNYFRLGSENVGRGSAHWGMRALHNLPSRLTLGEKRELFAHTFSFSYVRHPFVRLVSTYKSKVLRSVSPGESKLHCQWFQRLFNPLPIAMIRCDLMIYT